MSEITIFTAPKPFTDIHIATIQRNAIQSWIQLGSDVQVILIGEEDGIADTAAELGVLHLPDVGRNAQGTPLVSSIFSLAREASHGPFLAYLNADILLFSDFVPAIRQVGKLAKYFLVVGQRWDLDVTAPIDFTPGWEPQLYKECQQSGKLHPRQGSDYFVYPRECFTTIPDFAIGRAGWDNWMIYAARRQGWPLIDATPSIRIIHQNHDYRHLPNGQPHYRLPETGENIRLAGGQMITRFTLIDCNRTLKEGELQSLPFNWRKFWREVEIFPLVRLGSRTLGWLGYALFHPSRAYWQVRVWFSRNILKHPVSQTKV